MVIFAILCALLAGYGGSWLSDRADSFYHLAAIHRQIDAGTPLPQGLFYDYEKAPQGLNVTAGTWHLVLSIFSIWANVDISWLWQHLALLLVPLLVFSFYSFAYYLTGRPWLALIGTLLQFILYDRLDFRFVVYPNQTGFILLWSAWILTIMHLNSCYHSDMAVDWDVICGDGKLASPHGRVFLRVVGCLFCFASDCHLVFSEVLEVGYRDQAFAGTLVACLDSRGAISCF